MSQPVPDAERKPSIFAVPAHIHNVLIGGGCGVMHLVQNGAVDCERCFQYAVSQIWPASPEQNVVASATSVEITLNNETPTISEPDPAPAKARAKTQPTE